MNFISLYIDKWYIAGSIFAGNTPYPLQLPNREDRIWLYFHDDQIRNQVYYSRNNRPNCLCGQKDYLCDIFNLLVNSNPPCIHRYGSEVPLKEIFSASGIFDDLKKSYQNATGDDIESIPLYLTFSKDIPASVFALLRTLFSNKGFNVGNRDYVSIELLSLYHTLLQNEAVQFSQEKFILALNAANEDLKISVYSFNEEKKMFALEGESELKGKGLDIDNQAIVRLVVKSINDIEHLLHGEEEFNHEVLLQMEHADEWRTKVRNQMINPDIPVSIGNVVISGGNSYSTSILPKDVDGQARTIITDITEYIKVFLNEKLIHPQDISHILFVGDIFDNNKLYKEELLKIAPIPYSNIISVPERKLSIVVSSLSNRQPDFWKEQKELNEEALAKRKKLERERNKDTISGSSKEVVILDLVDEFESLSHDLKEKVNDDSEHLKSMIENAVRYLEKANFDSANQALVAYSIPSDMTLQLLSKKEELFHRYQNYVDSIDNFSADGRRIDLAKDAVNESVKKSEKDKASHQEWFDKVSFYKENNPEYLSLRHQLNKTRSLPERRTLLNQIKKISMVPQDDVELPHVTVDLKAEIITETIKKGLLKKKVQKLVYSLHIVNEVSDSESFPCNVYLNITNETLISVKEASDNDCIVILVEKGRSGYEGAIELPDPHFKSGKAINLYLRVGRNVFDRNVLKSPNGDTVYFSLTTNKK